MQGMTMAVETVIDAAGRDFAGWGVQGDRAVLLVQVGSRKVVVSMPAADAKELGCGGIFAGGVAAQHAAARAGEPAHGGSRILGADGMPIGEVSRG